jgi:hypothetical protein
MEWQRNRKNLSMNSRTDRGRPRKPSSAGLRARSTRLNALVKQGTGAESHKLTFPRWILVGRCCTLPMTNVTAVGSVDQGFSDSGKHSEPPRHLKSAANTIRGADLPLWNSRQVTLCSSFHGLTPFPVQVDWPEAVRYAAESPGTAGVGSPIRPSGTSRTSRVVSLGTDLHQLLPQCCERPVLHATGQRHTAQEVGQVVGRANSCRRTWLSAKQRQESRVHLSAYLPSLIHCAAVPRPL